jgi:adenosylcobyric acid synthase
MIQGTGSGAGKSLLVAALCRVFNNKGLRVAPFKSQNMALNSFITKGGGEIGRAQALQAEAARIEPTVDMNPILLKAMGERGSQVIVHGRVHGTYSAKDYYDLKKTLWPKITESIDRLMNEYDLIIIEGAGSPAEINLMDKEIVNMAIARYIKSPVLLLGDIDRGGVFASLYGTIKLLGRDSKFIKGYVINKFRGDKDILLPGLELIKNKTGRPVIGVLPYVEIGLPEEDGLSLSSGYRLKAEGLRLKIVILRLNYISNFTDFDPFLYEPDVELLYSNSPADIENADIVIVPGTKNTVKDLLYLKEKGLDKSLWKAYSKGIEIIGICGGYQILGKKIFDPFCVESDCKEIDGLGLLNIETTFEKTKVTCQVEAEIALGSWLMAHSDKNYELSAMNCQPLRGYEIHKGISYGDIGLFKIKRINPMMPHLNTVEVMDGSIKGNCWGTYMHGIFENDLFRRTIINKVRKNKNLPPLDSFVKYSEIKDRAIDNLARIVEENVDMDFIKRLIKL